VPFLILIGRLTWCWHMQENLELQRVQGDLENQLRKRQREIESLQAEITKRDSEHRTKHTGGGSHFSLSLSLSLSHYTSQTGGGSSCVCVGVCVCVCVCVCAPPCHA
jgi:hypothetical protein